MKLNRTEDPKPREITGYDIIIHWSDGEKEDLEHYTDIPYLKSLEHILDSVEEEVNSQLEDEE